jgi:hypothetical protein
MVLSQFENLEDVRFRNCMAKKCKEHALYRSFIGF